MGSPWEKSFSVLFKLCLVFMNISEHWTNIRRHTARWATCWAESRGLAHQYNELQVIIQPNSQGMPGKLSFCLCLHC